jgi:hypothetical protein
VAPEVGGEPAHGGEAARDRACREPGRGAGAEEEGDPVAIERGDRRRAFPGRRGETREEDLEVAAVARDRMGREPALVREVVEVGGEERRERPRRAVAGVHALGSAGRRRARTT